MASLLHKLRQTIKEVHRWGQNGGASSYNIRRAGLFAAMASWYVTVTAPVEVTIDTATGLWARMQQNMALMSK